MNRLLEANYSKPDNASTPNNFKEHLNYDKNGNITQLQRNGDLDSNGLMPAMLIDDLIYTYHPQKANQLMKVIDFTNSPQGFKDGTNSDDDYSYDANGNMTVDQNKGISNITYNHLNLPTEVEFGVTGKIEYLYNATGQKVAKIVTEGSNITQHDYLAGGFQYKGGDLQFFPHPEGYVNIIDYKGIKGFNYVYNYTDHLGNIRLSYGYDPATENIKIIEENHYYPFGLKHTNYNSDQLLFVKTSSGGIALRRPAPTTPLEPSYKYKYNGQEWQDELGLNWYTYRHRNYDPAIGRFMGIDPISEEYYTITNYQFAHNNPVWKIELEGLEGAPSNGQKDIVNNEPVYLSKNIVLNTVIINSQKEKHSRPGTPSIRYGVGFRDTYSGTIGGDNLNADGSITPIQLSCGMAICIDGERVEYSATIARADGSVNALGESVVDGQFTTLDAYGSYNLRSRESTSSVNILTNDVNTIFGDSQKENKVDDFIFGLNFIGGYIEANATELGNNLQDLGNLVSSWLEALVREHFDPDNSGANPIVD